MPVDFYHYASATIHRLVMASTPNRVPNFDIYGTPRTVYFTDVLFTSAAAAETALLIGAKHPAGPRSSPVFRFDLDVTLCAYTNLGIVPGGTATEYITTGSLIVTASARLSP